MPAIYPLGIFYLLKGDSSYKQRRSLILGKNICSQSFCKDDAIMYSSQLLDAGS